MTIGETALHLGWWATLAKVESVLEEMVEEGILQRYTDKWEDVTRYGRCILGDVGLRARKNHLLLVLRTLKIAHGLSDEQVTTFEMLFRRAKTQTEQDEVRKALEAICNGWKDDADIFSRLLRDVHDVGTVIGEEEDPPLLREALARSRVTFSR